MTDSFYYIVILILHAGVSILAGYWFYFQFVIDLEQARVWRWLGFLFSFFLPVYGLVGIFFIYFALKKKASSKKQSSGRAFDEHLHKNRISAAARDLTLKNINWQEEREIQPLVDALKDMDVELRKGAVDALAAKGDHEAIRMLADSLENTVLEVRYFAVEALAKISKDFGEQIVAAQKKFQENPDSFQAITELANCYYEYATSNVEDETLSEFYLNQALAEYEKALNIKKDDTRVLTRYGEILVRLDKFQEALQTFENVAAHDKNNVDARVHLADIYFKMGKIKKVLKIVRQFKALSDNLPEEIRQAVSVWV